MKPIRSLIALVAIAQLPTVRKRVKGQLWRLIDQTARAPKPTTRTHRDSILMKTKTLLRPLAVLIGLGFAAAATSAAESIESSVKNLFKALDAGDRATLLAHGPSEEIPFPVLIFDYDWDNKPMTFEGVAGVRKFMNTTIDELAKRRMKVVSVVSNLRADSRSSDLGFAVFDLSQTMTVDGKSEISRFRLTALLSQDRKTGRWRMFHWHASLVPSAAPPGK